MYCIIVRKQGSEWEKFENTLFHLVFIWQDVLAKMSGLFTLLEVDSRASSSSRNDTKTRVPNVAVEIPRGFWLSLEWDDMYAIYVKLDIMHIHRFQANLDGIIKHIEDNKLNQYVKKSDKLFNYERKCF